MINISSVRPGVAVAAAALVFRGVAAGQTPRLAEQPASCEMGEPHPDAPEQIRDFGFLIGNWAVKQRLWDQGAWSEGYRPAYWEARYVLGGFAIVDYWYDSPPWTGVTPPGRGINVRMYNPSQGFWEMTWQHTGLEGVRRLRAQKQGDRVIMWQLNPDGTRFAGRRTAFHDITSDGWVRTDEISEDGGRTWRYSLRIEATRLPCPVPPGLRTP